MEYIIIILLIIILIISIISLTKNINESNITERLGKLETNVVKEIGEFKSSFSKDLGNDFERLNDAYKRIDIMPLGAGALACSTYNIDNKRNS